jgi:hypothetical protein
LPNATAVAVAQSAVLSVTMISRSGIFSTGEK